MTALEIRLALYGVLLAAIGGWLLYERAHLIDEGEARVKAADAAATARQKQEDARLSGETIDALHQQLAALAATAPAARPAPVMRLCIPTRFVSAQPAAGGAQPAQPANAGVDTGVPGGATAGADIGPGVSDIALAGMLLATYRGQLWNWSVSQAQTPPAP